eukprot:gene5220-biopygen1934
MIILGTGKIEALPAVDEVPADAVRLRRRRPPPGRPRVPVDEADAGGRAEVTRPVSLVGERPVLAPGDEQHHRHLPMRHVREDAAERVGGPPRRGVEGIQRRALKGSWRRVLLGENWPGLPAGGPGVLGIPKKNWAPTKASAGLRAHEGIGDNPRRALRPRPPTGSPSRPLGGAARRRRGVVAGPRAVVLPYRRLAHVAAPDQQPEPAAALDRADGVAERRGERLVARPRAQQRASGRPGASATRDPQPPREWAAGSVDEWRPMRGAPQSHPLKERQESRDPPMARALAAALKGEPGRAARAQRKPAVPGLWGIRARRGPSPPTGLPASVLQLAHAGGGGSSALGALERGPRSRSPKARHRTRRRGGSPAGMVGKRPRPRKSRRGCRMPWEREAVASPKLPWSSGEETASPSQGILHPHRNSE